MKYLIACLVALLLVFIIMMKIAISQNEKIKQLKNELQKEKKIEEQKEKINSGNTSADFDNSINILSKYAESKK